MHVLHNTLPSMRRAVLRDRRFWHLSQCILSIAKGCASMKNRLGQMSPTTTSLGGTCQGRLASAQVVRRRAVGCRRLSDGAGSGSRCRIPRALILALALAGCAPHPKFIQTYCLTQAQFDQLKQSQPPKVRSQLIGEADKDLRIIAGSAIRLRAYSDGLISILGGCIDRNTTEAAAN